MLLKINFLLDSLAFSEKKYKTCNSFESLTNWMITWMVILIENYFPYHLTSFDHPLWDNCIVHLCMNYTTLKFKQINLIYLLLEFTLGV